MHAEYLQQTCDLASTRRGQCAPNPAVGALVVQNGRVIARGVTQNPGGNHAEIEALEQVKALDLDDATLYVSLEPCCHWGKTPPCTDAIIESGIQQVVYGYQDPNPVVDGGGARTLKAAGVRCEYVHIPTIDVFYQSYAYWVSAQRPWVTAKLAMTLDGITAHSDGQPMQITSDQAKQRTFALRQHSDAILTSASTIVHDDPQLNIRFSSSPAHYRPIYLIDRQLRAPLSARVFSNPAKITVFYSAAFSGKLPITPSEQCRYIPIDDVADGLDLAKILAVIGADGVHDLWVEAGSTLFNSMGCHGHLHRAMVYVAPKVGAVGLSAHHVSRPWWHNARAIEWAKLGPDVVIDYQLTVPTSGERP